MTSYAIYLRILSYVVRVAIAYVPAGRCPLPRHDDVEVLAVTGEGGVGRDGLLEALERIGAGEASTLLVARLADVANSLREAVGLLDWLGACGGELIALDVGLDTATRVGSHLALLLREIERWERETGPEQPSRGRPGLAHRSPELAQRINALRDGGQSLRAIAELLNDEGVPTPRGGERWRPSSVQAALGYRRPRPPTPGLPGPAPRSPRHGPHLPPAKPPRKHPRAGKR